ncbi:MULTISPECIES: hypothetical protein [unclassified Clostridium]|uniref:hypothetical protein n=1 Tax=unclassified Clostridium TaxID=2614128 RepID=UPI0025BED556|nr:MULTISPECIES: hypothetical protein [unclassified Clostridium]
MQEKDTMRELCIQQGYVPATCILDGMIIYSIIQKCECPCDGCNANRDICKGKRKTYGNHDEIDKLISFIDVFDRAEKRERYEAELRYKQMIKQRKEGHKNNFIVNILEIRWEYSARERYIEVIAKDIIDEKAYCMKYYEIFDMLKYLPCICYKYHIQQIHVEENTHANVIYEEIKKLNIHKVDVVPLRYVKMKL